MREFETACIAFTKVISEFAKQNNIPPAEMIFVLEVSKDRICQDITLARCGEFADNRMLKMMPMSRNEQ